MMTRSSEVPRTEEGTCKFVEWSRGGHLARRRAQIDRHFDLMLRESRGRQGESGVVGEGEGVRLMILPGGLSAANNNSR